MSATTNITAWPVTTGHLSLSPVLNNDRFSLEVITVHQIQRCPCHVDGYNIQHTVHSLNVNCHSATVTVCSDCYMYVKFYTAIHCQVKWNMVILPVLHECQKLGVIAVFLLKRANVLSLKSSLNLRCKSHVVSVSAILQTAVS